MALDGPFPDPAALPDPGGVDQLGHEVPAEGPPEGAVLSRVDGALPDAEDEPDGGVGRAAREDGSFLDQGLVDELGAGHDDEGPLAHLHGEDRAVLGPQVADYEHEGPALEDDLAQVPDEWPSWWARREVAGTSAGGRPVSPP